MRRGGDRLRAREAWNGLACRELERMLPVGVPDVDWIGGLERRLARREPGVVMVMVVVAVVVIVVVIGSVDVGVDMVLGAAGVVVHEDAGAANGAAGEEESEHTGCYPRDPPPAGHWTAGSSTEAR